ncbi:uncharacterized protein BDV14DRAFT_177137 [Aspergillus stella-maris]|uniref:uncharacterized protein n=1 Tax=Aspergillus stella-maris TaxID=1810926 RepID=UPI003CCD9CC2
MMTRTIVKVRVWNPDHGSEGASLDAAIDDTVAGNIILHQCWKHIHGYLGLDNIAGYPSTTIQDSQSALYTVQSMVELQVRSIDRPWTRVASFYVSESEHGLYGDRFQIILGHGWRERFRLPSDDGTTVHLGAPTLYHYNGSDDREKREEEAKKTDAERRKKAQQSGDDFKRRQNDRIQNAQSASSTR